MNKYTEITKQINKELDNGEERLKKSKYNQSNTHLALRQRRQNAWACHPAHQPALESGRAV